MEKSNPELFSGVLLLLALSPVRCRFVLVFGSSLDGGECRFLMVLSSSLASNFCAEPSSLAGEKMSPCLEPLVTRPISLPNRCTFFSNTVDASRAMEKFSSIWCRALVIFWSDGPPRRRQRRMPSGRIPTCAMGYGDPAILPWRTYDGVAAAPCGRSVAGIANLYVVHAFLRGKRRRR